MRKMAMPSTSMSKAAAQAVAARGTNNPDTRFPETWEFDLIPGLLVSFLLSYRMMFSHDLTIIYDPVAAHYLLFS